MTALRVSTAACVISLLASVLLLGACSTARPVATLNEAVTGLENDLAALGRAGYAATSDLLSPDGDRAARATQYLRERQCAYQSANPLFLVPDTEVGLDLKGTFSTGGTFKVTGIGGLTPLGEIGGSISAGSEQVLKMKVHIVSLTGVPREYAKTISAYADTKGLPPELKDAALTQLKTNYPKLVTAIQSVQASFKLSDCPAGKK